MKQSLSFPELRERVASEAALSKDYLCPTNELLLDATATSLATPCGQFHLRDTAHSHLAELCGIDRRYYQRMRTEAPLLLMRNVSHWLAHTPPKQRMLRCHGNDLRALTSPRYAVLDNSRLLETVEPVIDELGLSVESCDVSDEKLYLKMISPRLTGEVQVGDPVQAGVVIRNSEVRASAVEIALFTKRLICTNGMIVDNPSSRGAFRRHVGRDWSRTNGVPQMPFGEIPPNTERDAWEKAIWNSFQDTLRNSLNEGDFHALLERLRLTTTFKTRLQPDKLVERLAEQYRLSPAEETSVLYHLMRDEDMTLYGLLNAVTRTAQDVESYELATSLEELGGRLAHLTPREWSRLTAN